jgi:hypothetical protein
MASPSIYQKRKEEVKRVHEALTNGVNPLSKEEADFVELCCRILGIEYKDKADAVEVGRRDRLKTIKAIRSLLKKLGADLEQHRSKSLEPSQVTWNMDGLAVHACSLKHPESSIKGLQEALNTGYKMDIRLAWAVVQRNLEDFRVTLNIVTIVGHGKQNKRNPGRIRVFPCAKNHRGQRAGSWTKLGKHLQLRLKILESSHYKQVSVAQSIDEDAGKRN